MKNKEFEKDKEEWKCATNELLMKQKQKYKFKIKSNDKLGYKGVLLKDGTQIILTKQGLSVMFPKKKFLRILTKQIEDKGTHVGVTFDNQELEAISVGFEMLGNEDDK